MRSPQLSAMGTASINMTPMIDVVFLLIIFFLVSSHLAKQENRIPLKLPLAGSGLDDEVVRETVVVNVLESGVWQLAGVDVTEPEIQIRLRQRQAVAAEPLRLRIRTDENVAYQRIEPILSAASEAGIGDIVFSVVEDRR